MNSNEYLFDNPNVEISPEGDVIPSHGDVKPVNPYKAAAELRHEHPFELAQIGQLSLTEDVEVEAVKTLETEEDPFILSISRAALQHRIATETRVLGLGKTKEIKLKIQNNLASQNYNRGGRSPGR